jgi:hypothetical protein
MDWETDRFEGIGLVPGDHGTLGPNASEPIARRLEEAPDGTLWGDTNRWLFRFDPESREIEPLADMVSVDDACYGLFLPYGPEPTQDCHFAIFSRFSGPDVGTPFYAYRTEKKRVEPQAIDGWVGSVVGHPEWWRNGGANRLLVPTWDADAELLTVAVVDPFGEKLVERWEVEGNPTTAGLLPGGGLYFLSGMTGGLMEAEAGRLKMVAENPIPVECRCLGASPGGVLGTDTNDCGHAFTLDMASGTRQDHGKVWRDDHRCNYGPAAFAGHDGRYFLANHSQGMPSLWVTDTTTDRHWKAGEPAVQLERLTDGTVWGTVGPNPTTMEFEPGRSWVPSWQAGRGALFRYRPGERQAETLEQFPEVGPLTEAPAGGGHVLMACGSRLVVYDPERGEVIAEMDLPGEPAALSRDGSRSTAYLLLEDETLWSVRQEGNSPGLALTRVAEGFGSHERGFFVLPESGRVIGIAVTGTVTVFDPENGALGRIDGPVPLPAGPAVDPAIDAWYFADRSVSRYTLRVSS